MLFIIIAVGFMAAKLGFFSAQTRKDMTDVVLLVVLPCNIFSSFGKNISPEVLWQCLIVVLVSTGMHIFYTVLSKFLYERIRPERREVAQYGTIISNSSFLGRPVFDAVYGQTGLLYGALILIPLRIFMWTAGLSLFTSIETKQKLKILLSHPCMWAVILGFAYIFAPFELPYFLENTISTIGSCTTALSMLIVGSILSGIDPKSVLDKDCFYFSLLRLVVIPALVFAILYLLRIDPIVTGVSVLSAAMPAAMTTAMLANKYGRDAVFASKMIFVSTALSLVTLPIIANVLTSLLDKY